MFNFQVFSDIHWDFDRRAGRSVWMPTVTNRYSPPNPQDVTLFLPGDLDYASHVDYPISKLAEMYKRLVVVLGNHDYWHSNATIDDTNEIVRETFSRYDNVHLLHNESIVLDDVLIYGGTCWTDMDALDPLVMLNAPRTMVPDFEYIVGMTADEWCTQHGKFITNLFDAIDTQRPGQRMIVVGHHLPSYQSVHPRYRVGGWASANPYFASDLEYAFFNTNIDVWLHGHTHDSFDYNINTTRVICNPRGYNDENLCAMSAEVFTLDNEGGINV